MFCSNSVLFHRSALFAPPAWPHSKSRSSPGPPAAAKKPCSTSRASRPPAQCPGPAAIRACGSSSRPRRSGRSTTPSPPSSCPAAWSAKRANRPPAIPPPMRPMTGWGTPTASTPKPSDGTRSTARASASMPRSTTAACTTTRSGTASRWSSATATARSSSGSRNPSSVIGHELDPRRHPVLRRAGLPQPGRRPQRIDVRCLRRPRGAVRPEAVHGGGQLADRRRPASRTRCRARRCAP